MRLKDGATLEGVHNDLVVACSCVLDRLWWRELGYELVITSGRDSHFDRISRHNIGAAVDVRTWQAHDDPTQLHGIDRDNFLELVRKELSENSDADFLVLDKEYPVMRNGDLINMKHHFHIQLEKSA